MQAKRKNLIQHFVIARSLRRSNLSSKYVIARSGATWQSQRVGNFTRSPRKTSFFSRWRWAKTIIASWRRSNHIQHIVFARSKVTKQSLVKPRHCEEFTTKQSHKLVLHPEIASLRSQRWHLTRDYFIRNDKYCIIH